MGAYYTYIHKTKDGKVFYVGKGQGPRARVHSGKNRSKRWHEMVAARGLRVEICAHWGTEREAYDHERFLIWCFLDMGFELLNQTKGGGGASGMTQSAESNALRSKALTGRKRPPEIGQKIAEKLRGRARPVIKEIEEKRVAAAIAAKAKKVLCVDTGEVFDSLSAAARKIGGSIAPISMALHGRRSTAHGYRWRFA